MKANKLRQLVDRAKPHFQPGGKLAKLQSTFDAFETFLFVPDKVTSKGAHIRDSIDLKRTMTIVILALLSACSIQVTSTFCRWGKTCRSFHGMLSDLAY